MSGNVFGALAQASDATKRSLSSLMNFIGQVDTIIFYDPELFSSTYNYTGSGFKESTKQVLKGLKKQILSRRQLYYKFRINPYGLAITQTKVQSQVLTKNGYENQYHGESMIQYAYSGSTGYMKSFLINDIRFSPAWIKLQGLLKFYEDSIKNIKMYYDGMIHEGFFSNFNFNKDANDPFQIKYNFVFMVYPNQSHALTSAASLPSVQTAIDVGNIVKTVTIL